MIRRLMLSYPEVEWIWWMDSDALTCYSIKHNLVIHGYPNLLFDQQSWIALNIGSFLFRNCQWSLDLLDTWAPMGPKGPIRDEAGKILIANLKGRSAFKADDQSALIYLLISQQDKWMDKVFIENSYYLHGYWAGLVDRYEEMIEKYYPSLGDERWPFVTHFVDYKPYRSYRDYPIERCLRSIERAFNLVDNQKPLLLLALFLALDLELELWLSPVKRNHYSCWLSNAIGPSFGTESLAPSIDDESGADGDGGAKKGDGVVGNGEGLMIGRRRERNLRTEAVEGFGFRAKAIDGLTVGGW
ncbi:hypothetical protein CRG98_000102 [Punica granatum]|uniref:Uncharacterized protein n=1 Tax=Punica granatum TaxID=22663 RepID=A0A2I0LFL8_PUNGR|nr:hypothetical protein CRG98_000102 [Punica granatum]